MPLEPGPAHDASKQLEEARGRDAHSPLCRISGSPILSLHNHWILRGKLQALFYVVGDEDAERRIGNGMRRDIFLTDGRVLIELLDTIKQQAIEGFQAKRAKRDEHALAQADDRRDAVAATAPASVVRSVGPSTESDCPEVTSTTAGIAWKWTLS